MDFYTTIWLVGGAVIGTCIGWGVHALFMKRYLQKHLPEHPEYRLYLDIINGNVNEEEKD